ncbi:probable E3 ubiquitin-protein ligase HERC4 [Morus notabilis]|uniref:probable E3 ubiquitin-protein ligase HERC4 n=1 Tax=Morus notabilis TaxID=981085 RepID=UPI000CED0591|nr:probable E3 ubiquitin-protein ligase HERC4 [Morus notabilis]
MADTGKLSTKVVAVAAGEAHTLALTGDGRIYSWGRGMFGRLGTGKEADELTPVEVKFENSEETRIKFVGVASGAYHSLAVADDGSVWSWGYNIYGQLGFDGENSAKPCLLEQFLNTSNPDSSTDDSETKSKTVNKVSNIKAGGMTSLAIDNLGALWIWGNYLQQNSSPEGGFSFVSSFTPTPVRDFLGHAVVKVACGNEHVVALVSAGEVHKGEVIVCYSWGTNKHGQLGLGDRESRHRPEIVKTFNQDSPWAAYEVACGAFHTALLTHKKRANGTLESACWTFGLGENGQLGHGTTQSTVSPEHVKELPDSVHLISVDCGLFHTSVVSSAGDVWSWGMERGLGLCPDARVSAVSGDATSPLLISCSEENAKFQNPIQVTCGAAHTVLVGNDGYKLWAWGRGRSGVLGNGITTDCLTPTSVSWPELTEDPKQEETKTVGEEDKGTEEQKDSQEVAEADEKLKALQLRLSTMEQYVSLLHHSIFGKPYEEKDIPTSLLNSGTFDIAKEWENMLESADRAKLMRLEMFYRNMLSGVKDQIMKKRVLEALKECLSKGN